jgi:hypothetical protein
MERTELETSKYLQKPNTVRTTSLSRSPSPQSRENHTNNGKTDYENVNKETNIMNKENFEKIKRDKDFKLKNIIATSTPSMHNQNAGNHICVYICKYVCIYTYVYTYIHIYNHSLFTQIFNDDKRIVINKRNV